MYVYFKFKECDGEIVSHAGKVTAGNVFGGRTVTLQMLLSAGILQAGPGTMTIEYLVRFTTKIALFEVCLLQNVLLVLIQIQ